MPSKISPEDRERYIKEYAEVLGVPPNAFEIAAEQIRTHQQYKTACAFAFNLSRHDPKHVEYITRAAEWLKNYVGENYSEVTADWMYQLVVGYTQEVDPSYAELDT